MKYKTEWNLGLLYKSENDPQIEKDVKIAEEACSAFEKKYKGKDFVSTSKKLLIALKEYEDLILKISDCPSIYLHLSKDIHTSNMDIAAKQSVFDERLQKAINKSVFFELAIAAIPAKQQNIYLKDSSLKHFNYFLKKIFTTSKYNLSEKEEKLLGLVSQTSRQMWVNANKKLLNEQFVSYKGKKIPMSEAVEIISDLPKKDRKQLQKDTNTVLKSIAFMAEAEINAVYNFKKIIDEERGYEHPFTSTVLRYENDEKEVMDLVTAVTKYFSISKKYYKLHAKLLKEDKIGIPELYTKFGEIKKKFDFESGVSIIKSAFEKFDKKYVELFEAYLTEGRIDVFPRKQKSGGGYCMYSPQLPTYVFLNYVENIKSVETLAHEMGHAFHGELSRNNSPVYTNYTISVAEVASTFFEQFVSDEIQPMLSDEEKMISLHQRIGRDIATVMRQIACFNFELELHQRIRKEGQVSKDSMASLMAKHLRSYLGEAVQVDDDDGYIFVRWSHIRSFFYVYSYAYGLLISRALYEKWKENPEYKTKIEQFLSAGGSMSPKDIFKSIGINTDEAFFEAGLKGMEADVKKLEKLAKKYKKI